jgi:hypothetical protein
LRKILIFLVTVVGMGIAGVVGRNVADWALPPPVGGRPTHELLAEAIEVANRGLPKMIDKETRHDRVTSPSPMVLQHNYTLVELDTPLPGEFAEIEKQLREMIVGRACAPTGIPHLLKQGVSAIYSYNAADGKFFGAVTVRPTDCPR